VLLALTGHRLVHCKCLLLRVKRALAIALRMLLMVQSTLVFCAYMSRGIGALYGWGKKGRTMALDTNTFLIILVAAVMVMGFVVWVMFKKVS